VVVLGAVALFCGALFAWTRLGAEFIPTLDEQDILVIISHIPGTSLGQTLEMQKGIDETLEKFPEVATVFAQIGTGAGASAPMPRNERDIYVMLKPRKQWPNPRKPKEQLVKELEDKLDLLPGNIYEFIQPIQDRFNELIAGVTSDVAVKIFGDDLDVL